MCSIFNHVQTDRCSTCYRLTSETTQVALTSFSLRTQGFWALRKPSSVSLVSLKPPIICLWKASFCQLRTFSLSSPASRSRSSRCSSLSRSAACMKACHAFSSVPYWGPEEQVWERSNILTNVPVCPCVPQFLGRGQNTFNCVQYNCDIKRDIFCRNNYKTNQCDKASDFYMVHEIVSLMLNWRFIYRLIAAKSEVCLQGECKDPNIPKMYKMIY